MAKDPLHFIEITDPNEDPFLHWLDLFEISFPANEKLLFSTLLKILKSKGQGEAAGMRMIAIQDEEGRTVGMTLYQLLPEKSLATLWYLATDPSERSRGLGGKIYEQLISGLDPSLYKALILEVEIPGEIHSSPDADRRIRFYKRNGAYLLRGIHYLQDIGWHQPQTPMHLMVHPLQPLTPEQVFQLAQSAFGDLIHQTGPLSLED